MNYKTLTIILAGISLNLSAQISAPGFRYCPPEETDTAIEETLPLKKLFRAPEVSGAPVMRLVEYKKEDFNTVDNQSIANLYKKWSYNKYGFKTAVNTIENGETKNSSYSYEWETPGIWNKKVTDGINTETRTFHPSGGVASRHIYDLEDNLTEETYYDEYGFMVSGNRYAGETISVYFAPLQQWYTNTNSNEYEVSGVDKIVKDTYFFINSDNEKITNSVRYRYFIPAYTIDEDGISKKYVSIGDYKESYNSGNLYSSNGTKVEYGKDSYTVYSISSKMNPDYSCIIDTIQKTEYTNNYWSPMHSEDTAPRVKTTYKRNDSGDFVITERRTRTWVNDFIHKVVTETPANSDETLYVVASGSESISPIYYEPESGNYGFCSYISKLEVGKGIPGYTADLIYYYYDASNQLISQIKKYDNIYWAKYNLETQEYEPCTEAITIYSPDNSNIKIEFDSETRMTKSVAEYFDRVEISLYTYYETGYEFSTYIQDKAAGTSLLTDKYSYSDIDNIITEITEKYNSDGSTINSALKNIWDYNTMCNTRYLWKNNNWKEDSYSGINTLEYLPDGIHYEYITRKYNSYTTPAVKYNTRLIENIPGAVPGYTYYELSNWNGDYWSGNKRYYRHLGSDRIEINYTEIEPAAFDDDYFMTKNNCNNHTVVLYHNADYHVWSWEYSDWMDWTHTSQDYDITSSGENAIYNYYNKYEILYDGSGKDDKYTYEIRPDGQITRYIFIRNDAPVNTQYYTYSPDGLLIIKIEEKDGEITKEYFTYADVSNEIENSLNEPEKANVSISVLGRTIYASATTEVYNLQGVKVAVIPAEGSATMPSAGIFIARASDYTQKIVVK